MNPCVLVVEDNDATREALSEILNAAGYDTAAAENGRQALDYLHQHPDRPSVILLDMMMPVMDGWEFLRRKRKEPPLAPVPVVVFSAASGINLRTMQALGAVDVLAKPADPADLIAAVARHC
jgi:CheY-like chemotaxis protein